MPQYSMEYDADMCEWYAKADDREYTAETPQQTQQWLAAQIRKDETDEERQWLAHAQAWASRQK